MTTAITPQRATQSSEGGTTKGSAGLHHHFALMNLAESPDCAAYNGTWHSTFRSFVHPCLTTNTLLIKSNQHAHRILTGTKNKRHPRMAVQISSSSSSYTAVPASVRGCEEQQQRQQQKQQQKQYHLHKTSSCASSFLTPQLAKKHTTKRKKVPPSSPSRRRRNRNAPLPARRRRARTPR